MIKWPFHQSRNGQHLCIMYLKQSLHIKGILPPIFSQKAISVHIFISNIRFMIYSYWVHGFIRFLRKQSLHFWTLGIIYHMIIAEKNGRHFMCFNHQNSTGSDFSHMIWLESLNGCSLLEENSMDKLKAATIFHSLCAKYSSPWKK